MSEDLSAATQAYLQALGSGNAIDWSDTALIDTVMIGLAGVPPEEISRRLMDLRTAVEGAEKQRAMARSVLVVLRVIAEWGLKIA